MANEGDTISYVKPIARVVFLGASNLTRGIASAVETSRLALGGPREHLIAYGNGRSYGIKSRFLMRDLPGIDRCELWSALAKAEPLPTYALLCDIGNDIAYQQPLDEIEAWVRFALERLKDASAKVSIMQLPLAHLDRITRLQFEVVRTMIFSARPLVLEKMKEEAREMARRMERIAAEYGAHLVAQKGEWYTYDPIHYPFSRHAEVWSEAMRSWKNAEVPRARVGFGDWLYLRSRPPAFRWLLGRGKHAQQPCGVLRDGSTVSVF